MPDISMCQGYDCPVKEACYRYLAIPNSNWQTWFAEDPRDEEHTPCDTTVKVCTHWMPYCPDCKKQVGVYLKFGGQICKNCRKVLRLPQYIPRSVYE